MTIIDGEIRLKKGKSFSRKLRKIYNKIPSIIYGPNKPTLYISLDHDLILNIEKKNNGFSNCILSINIKNNRYLVSVHDVQRHCFKKKILHIDFLYK